MASSSSDIDIDIDLSIQEQVKRAISRVAEIENEPICVEERPAPSKVTSDMLERQHQNLQDEMKLLESDIEFLEEKIAKLHGEKGEFSGSGGARRENEQMDDEELESAIFSLAGCTSESRCTDIATGNDLLSRLLKGGEESVDEETAHLRSQIKLNEAFNGIKFKSVDWEVKQKDGSGILREHTHTGSCHGHGFTVIFVVNEEKSTEHCISNGRPDHVKIIHLRVEVDQRAQNDMQTFLTRISEDCDLMLFYQTYLRYCLILEEREQTFMDAKSKLGNNIHIHERSNRLQISLGRRVNFYCTWNLSVSARGVVDRSISVQVKTLSNASNEGLDGVFHMPQLLDKMILIDGHRDGFMKWLSLFEPQNK